MSDTKQLSERIRPDVEAAPWVIKEVEKLERELAAVTAERDEARKENDTLRGLLGNSAKPCVYCGLPAEDQAKCAHGFPGCARSDDQMLSKHFAAGYHAEVAEARVAELERVLNRVTTLPAQPVAYVLCKKHWLTAMPKIKLVSKDTPGARAVFLHPPGEYKRGLADAVEIISDREAQLDYLTDPQRTAEDELNHVAELILAKLGDNNG